MNLPFTTLPDRAANRYDFVLDIDIPSEWEGKSIYIHLKNSPGIRPPPCGMGQGLLKINGQPIIIVPFIRKQYASDATVNLTPYIKYGEKNHLELWPQFKPKDPGKLLLLVVDVTEQVPDMLTGFLQVFSQDILRQPKTDTQIRFPDSRLDRAREFIEENFIRPFDLAETASKIHLSPSHFCSIFSKQFGLPPREYAMRLRLQRATQLLANHDLAIFQVAEMVGFSDPLYFSKLFHRCYRISPSQFRQQLKRPIR